MKYDESIKVYRDNLATISFAKKIRGKREGLKEGIEKGLKEEGKKGAKGARRAQRRHSFRARNLRSGVECPLKPLLL